MNISRNTFRNSDACLWVGRQ